MDGPPSDLSRGGAPEPATQHHGVRLAPGISVLVPVYRGATTLPELAARVESVLGDGAWEIVFVDDCSPDGSWAVIERLSRQSPRIRGLRLSRNFGQHSALVAGVRSARFDVCVTIDDDLQNPPEEIPKLLAAINDDCDVVYGTSPRQSQDRWRRVAGRLTRVALRSSLGVPQAPEISAFRAFRTRLRGAFDGDIGPSVSLDALLSWGSSRFGSVPVSHQPRAVGESNYTFRKLLRFALDTATGYSTVPLQVASMVGFAMSLFGFGLLSFVIGRLLITGESVPGFPFLASAISIFSGVQLFALGIIGEYLARMHFRTMRRPTYVVREQTVAEGSDGPQRPSAAGSAPLAEP